MIDVLVTGGSGQVGQALRAARWPARWTLHFPSRQELDLADPAALSAVVASRPWAAVINSGAYTAVDRAESDTTAVWTVNAGAPRALAAATAKAGMPLIQLSTDYVFAGDKPDPYVESDPVGPLGVYGASKLAGEIAIGALNQRSLIFRTSWIVSPFGSNFARTVLRLGMERSVVRIVADQHGAPTTAREIARALLIIAERLIADLSPPTGIYHFTCRGQTTWFGLASDIFEEAARFGRVRPVVEAIATAEYPTTARRPGNSRLDSSKIGDDFGIVGQDWRDAVGETVRELLGDNR